MTHLMSVYKRLPVTFEHGEGVWLWDTEGNKYLDALCGIAVTGLGHAHPIVTKAIQTQAAKLLHTSNLFQIANQIALADTLARLTGMSKAFFCNSGAEAVETALKIARLYGHQKEIEFPHIVVMSGAFHGRTLATISAGGSARAQAGFEPMVQGFVHIPYNDIDALQAVASKRDDVVAVLVEPIQGEGGIIVPDANYIANIRSICNENNWLMILDEVQTGMGRTGSLFMYQTKKILPDILCIAKGLGNGVPIGACLAKDAAADVLKPGNHGSTFGGNPLACAAALATLEVIEKNKLWENAKKMGDLLINGLKERLKNNEHVKDVRGQGLMIGVKLDKPCREILTLALKKRLLFNITHDTVIRLLPPLIITEKEVQIILDTLPGLIDEFYTLPE